MSAPVPNYACRARYLGGHDGDSFWLRVDRGQLTHGYKDDPSWYVRLAGIDCWEITGRPHPKDPTHAKGRAAYDFTDAVLIKAKVITVQTLHPDDPLKSPDLEKYGRVLAHVWVDDQLLADLLRENGHEKEAL